MARRAFAFLLALASVAAAALFACGTSSGPPGGGVDGGADAKKPRPDATASDAPRDAQREADASDAREAAPPPHCTDNPVLTDLKVSPPATLTPAFSPCIHDYAIRCSAGKNDLSVTMTAAAGATSLLVKPTVSASLPEQTVTMTLYENDAVVAAASNGTSTTEYWIRCLPHDFPPLAWTTHAKEGTPPPGYYLVGNLEPLAAGVGYAIVLDSNGVPVWYAAGPAGIGVSTVDEVAPGAIAFTPFDLITSEPFFIRQLAPPATTTLLANGYVLDFHEIRALANGDYLVFSYPFRYGVDLTGLKLPLPDGGGAPLGKSEIIQDCTILEVTPAGKVVSTWNATDHFDPRKDTTEVIEYGLSPPDGGVSYDVFHCNSMDVDPATGNLLVSSREMSSVFYIDRASGKVLWKMGGKTASLDNATYVTVDSPFYQEHDARLIGWSPGCNGGTGQVSVFDDETNSPGGTGVGRGVLYNVVVGGDGGACDGGTPFDAAIPAPGHAKLAWEYKGMASVATAGSFRILPDGSHVIGWGLIGLPTVFTEVNAAGKDLLDFSFGGAGPSYRAIKVPLTALDLNVMRATAGLPL